ncbi:RNase A-like domain-containing protein [Enterobacter cloacae]|uniref:RNase A-like domain-containing protein n=1 Tax=Enterobacter cloacae TaxID=550 RepID=UPI0011E60FF4|nr:RNase A-like domain-containing protein [Enterobacter cloacae]ELK7549427.1 hypothetical protein [Enterobacter cloacae]ELV2766840.1 hypothetical protein [Enterobacter cloacae]ELV2780151.1 hypothetical protein [Enterobacter cloacae]MCK7173304.1 hypothetical protein [Enterobacter cloacae]TYR21601.1 hypothetical protein FYC79_20975 [Enterobacter cloacae]
MKGFRRVACTLHITGVQALSFPRYGCPTFTDRAVAEAVTSKAIDSNQAKIQNYLSGSQKGYLELDYQSSTPIGISVTRGLTSAVPVTNARIIIGRDPSMPDGYKIITGYPTQ